MKIFLLLLLHIFANSLKPLYYNVKRNTKKVSTLEILTEACSGMTHEQAEFLIDIGAVSKRDMNIDKVKWERVTGIHEIIEDGIQVRIYKDPRRFPSCKRLDPSDILHISDYCVVLNKPYNLPVMAHPSNAKECLIPCVQRHVLGEYRNKELRLVHRLDAVTSGIILLARSVSALQYFTRQFQERDHIEKEYSTLTAAPVPIGRIEHYQFKKTMGAQILANKLPITTDDPNFKSLFWKKSILEVLTCEEQKGQQYSSTVRLLTGRKHQIRAQLAALGCPCVGDTLYGPISGLTFQGSVDDRWSRGRSPETSIGLHASGISFIDMDGSKVILKCPPPWLTKNTNIL